MRADLEASAETLAALQDVANEARDWLLESAAPLWGVHGRTANGLFPERMSLAGEPDDSYFRTFVQARQIFSFIKIGELGWSGPWRALIEETTDVILRNARRGDGLFVHRLDRQAQPLDSRTDLYDQAFVLFALGVAGEALNREDLFNEAEALLDVLADKWSHPLGGFSEGEIVDSRLRRQNPHMHLLEAFLALHQGSGRERFGSAASSISRLAEDHFIDPGSGALLEYFGEDLAPAAGIDGRIGEPGHCFEWAWLFERLAGANGVRERTVSNRLTDWGRRYGLDQIRNVAINEVLTDGTVHDNNARLWPQTERLKAAAIRLRRLKSEAEAREALHAARGLAQYLKVGTPGLWRDKLRGDGSWIEEMAPGSSLYHISCAYAELLSCS